MKLGKAYLHVLKQLGILPALAILCLSGCGVWLGNPNDEDDAPGTPDDRVLKGDKPNFANAAPNNHGDDLGESELLVDNNAGGSDSDGNGSSGLPIPPDPLNPVTEPPVASAGEPEPPVAIMPSEVHGAYLTASTADLRCFYENKALNTYQVSCNATKKVNNSEVIPDALAEGTALKWNTPKKLTGDLEINECTTHVNGLSIACEVSNVTTLSEIELSFQISSAEVKREIRESVLIRLEIKVAAGFLPHQPYLTVLSTPSEKDGEQKSDSPIGLIKEEVPIQPYQMNQFAGELCQIGKDIVFQSRDQVFLFDQKTVIHIAGRYSESVDQNQKTIASLADLKLSEKLKLFCTPEEIIIVDFEKQFLAVTNKKSEVLGLYSSKKENNETTVVGIPTNSKLYLFKNQTDVKTELTFYDFKTKDQFSWTWKNDSEASITKNGSKIENVKSVYPLFTEAILQNKLIDAVKSEGYFYSIARFKTDKEISGLPEYDKSDVETFRFGIFRTNFKTTESINIITLADASNIQPFKIISGNTINDIGIGFSVIGSNETHDLLTETDFGLYSTNLIKDVRFSKESKFNYRKFANDSLDHDSDKNQNIGAHDPGFLNGRALVNIEKSITESDAYFLVTKKAIYKVDPNGSETRLKPILGKRSPKITTKLDGSQMVLSEVETMSYLLHPEKLSFKQFGEEWRLTDGRKQFIDLKNGLEKISTQPSDPLKIKQVLNMKPEKHSLVHNFGFFHLSKEFETVEFEPISLQFGEEENLNFDTPEFVQVSGDGKYRYFIISNTYFEYSNNRAKSVKDTILASQNISQPDQIKVLSAIGKFNQTSAFYQHGIPLRSSHIPSGTKFHVHHDGSFILYHADHGVIRVKKGIIEVLTNTERPVEIADRQGLKTPINSFSAMEYIKPNNTFFAASEGKLLSFELEKFKTTMTLITSKTKDDHKCDTRYVDDRLKPEGIDTALKLGLTQFCMGEEVDLITSTNSCYEDSASSIKIAFSQHHKSGHYNIIEMSLPCPSPEKLFVEPKIQQDTQPAQKIEEPIAADPLAEEGLVELLSSPADTSFSGCIIEFSACKNSESYVGKKFQLNADQNSGYFTCIAKTKKSFEICGNQSGEKVMGSFYEDGNLITRLELGKDIQGGCYIASSACEKQGRSTFAYYYENYDLEAHTDPLKCSLRATNLYKWCQNSSNQPVRADFYQNGQLKEYFLTP